MKKQKSKVNVALTLGNPKLTTTLQQHRAESQKIARQISWEPDGITLAVQYPYFIAADRCQTQKQFADWIRQLSEKTWMDKDRLAYFCRLVLEHIELKP